MVAIFSLNYISLELLLAMFCVICLCAIGNISCYDVFAFTQPASDRMMALVGPTRDSYVEEDSNDSGF